MHKFRSFLRPAGLLALTSLVCGLLFYIGGAILSPDLDSPPPAADQEDLSQVRELRQLTYDHDDPPVVWQDVDYDAGPDAAWRPKGEAPVLADLVAEGTIPPVAERVGSEPLVLQGCDGNGRYGGTWFRIASNPGDTHVMGWRLSGACLVRWSPMGHPIVPHVAKSFEVSEDKRIYTFHLREGMRWSDGHPFTTADIEYWWKHDILNVANKETPGRVPDWMRVGDAEGTIEIIDEHSFRYIFPEPHGLFLELLAKQHTFASPKHYLERFHPLIGDQDAITAEADRRDMDVDKPKVLYDRLKWHDNPHHPRLWAWIYRNETANPPFVWVRNPYFFAVDTAGNQLPYIDQLQFAVKQPKLINSAVSQGEVGMQRRHIKYQDYTLLMNSRRAGPPEKRYQVYHWFSATRSEFTVFPNLNRNRDTPLKAAKQELLMDKRFRQALSLAINREAIINAFYSGQTEPAQIDPGPDSPFHSPDLFKAYTGYEPERANALLDEIGLTERDSDGFRTTFDGKPLTFYLNTCSEWTGEGPGPFVIEDWRHVGLRVILRDRARSLWNAQRRAREHDLSVWTGESEFLPLLEARNFVARNEWSLFAPAYGIFFQKTGLSGDPERVQEALQFGAEDPTQEPAAAALVANMRDYIAIQRTADTQEQKRLWSRIAERCAENVWTISISTHPPQPVVVADYMMNVPEIALDGAGFYTPANTGIETYWIKEEIDGHAMPAAELSEGAYQQLRKAMTTVSDRYTVTTLDETGEGETVAADNDVTIGGVIITLFWGSILALILLMAFRHPFVMRRLLIMIPTLLIISIIGFTVIQLPPGDFLETKIAELKLQGDEAALEQVENLQELFLQDEPQIVRYTHWLGLHWFLSFDSNDAGLLQGDLGRSMENGQKVNELVGDRIVLTMLIALLSILLTWSIALVAGTYSATRQYTVGDYLLTFISFVGMSVPGFLLALVFIYISQAWFGIAISGLFSNEYAAQPEWDWGKVVDLLQHIWVPVLVAGIGGTAGLFRVMRGNLLDELRKPYVTTARAKGVRPTKLLIKYPVRVALNPVISTIGGLFPELISGGAIVAIVLNLPTVGPLMLNALLTEDMQLAGSMLMVLSLLGIFGTLVSDLLLLWLDPRIRMEGGSK